MRRWRGYLWRKNYKTDWEPDGFYIGLCERVGSGGVGKLGGPLMALPRLCLCLYVWTPLRQDVKVCGWERANSGNEWLHVVLCVFFSFSSLSTVLF